MPVQRTGTLKMYNGFKKIVVNRRSDRAMIAACLIKIYRYESVCKWYDSGNGGGINAQKSE